MRTHTKSKSTNRSCRVNHKAQRVIAFTPLGNQIGPDEAWSDSQLLRYHTSVMIKTQVQGTWTCWFIYANRLWGHRILYLREFKWQPIETINIKYLYLSVDKKNQLDVNFCIFISLLIVAKHVSGNHVPITRSWRLRDVIASCWYVPWLQEGGQVRLVGSASMDGFTGSIPAGVSVFFIDTKSYRSPYGPGVDSASNRNEYKEYLLGVKAAGA